MTHYYYYYLAHKGESNPTSGQGIVTTSVFNLKPLPTTSLRQAEILHHHRPHRRAVGRSTLNKTDEHCRSLFSLLPNALRPRHHQQTSNNKGIDAVSMKNDREKKMRT